MGPRVTESFSGRTTKGVHSTSDPGGLGPWAALGPSLEVDVVIREGSSSRIGAIPSAGSGERLPTIVTDVPGAEVLLHRHRIRGSRSIATFERSLGRTPIVGQSLSPGSYLCVLRAPGCHEVRYPLVIGDRDLAPEGPPTIHLPERGSLSEDEVYVPAGAFWSGGDREVFPPQPPRSRWVDPMVVQRFCVTNRQYLGFLNALVAEGRSEQATRSVPAVLRVQGGQVGFVRGAGGPFCLATRGIHLDRASAFPVVMVDWYSALAYASWRARSTGQPWRLPREIEWEKMARGVDGRVYPWGDEHRWTWCHTKGSHRTTMAPAVVDSYVVDQSPYGVRGAAGNCQEWCADAFVMQGALDPERGPPSDPLFRSVRGGSWLTGATSARATQRGGLRPDLRRPDLGFRLVRTWSPHRVEPTAARPASR